MLANIMVKVGHWDCFKQQLVPIREAVFIQEQQVPVELEWDTYDQTATHLLVLDQRQAGIACARLLFNTQSADNHIQIIAKIGRMAVMKSHRSQGIGKAILHKAIEIAHMNKQDTIQLSAQVQAVPFYEKSGFVVMSTPYLDANIWHVDMVKP